MRTLRDCVLALFSCMILLLTGCPNNASREGMLPDAPAEIAEGYIRVNYKDSGAWTLWVFNDFAEEEKNKCIAWPNGIPFAYQNGDFISVDVKLAEEPSKLGMIVVNSTGNKGTTDKDVIFNFPGRYNELFLFPNDSVAYVSANKGVPKGVSAAQFVSDTVITVSGDDLTLSASTVKIIDRNEKIIPISKYDSSSMTITLAESVKSSYSKNAPYRLTVSDSNVVDTVTISLDPSLIDSWFGTEAVKSIEADGLKLGVMPSGNTASFKTWAPLASSVSLLLYSDSSSLKSIAKSFPMDAEDNGFWIKKDVDISGAKYYQYEIENNGIKNKVSDIWAYVASADSVASQIATVDDAEATPADWETSYTNPWNDEDYRDAIIYEMHIRDWSRAVVSDSTGKFLDIANSKEIIAHLKDIGITHVQVLPMFDYSQKNDDKNYNWGYNPYHYNVPEGRYVTKDYKDGTQAVSEMRTMIKALHDAGIAVNMDVVYNHTSGTGAGSLYDMSVPEYFYRMSGSGYSNGSGCGNEVATNHAMVKHYVIESLKHWMNDYHINGFRFDLMGLHEQSTMKEIYEELYKIDPKVMVYGEPWTGGDSAVSNGVNGVVATTAGYGVGAFDDDFRDAIKGKEFGGFQIGHIQGSFSDTKIINGLKGGSARNSISEKAGLSLHYIECHDNYTLFDKLAYSAAVEAGTSGLIGSDSIAPKFPKSLTDAQLKTIKMQEKLAAAYIFLAQGTPFINGGQEFMRTKKGNPDSYAADTKGGITWTNSAGQYNIDDCNTIDLGFRTKYSDVYNTYKALIQIRKDFDAFRRGKYVEASSVDSTKGITLYSTDGSDGKTYNVYFNATDTDYTLKTAVKGYKFTISESTGTYSVSETEESINNIPARSFIILKK